MDDTDYLRTKVNKHLLVYHTISQVLLLGFFILFYDLYTVSRLEYLSF